MEHKIWRQLAQILEYRNDLIDTIRPFLDNLHNTYNNEIFRINEEKHIQFLSTLSISQICLLYKYKIIGEERYSIIESRIINLNTPKTELQNQIEEIIKGDKRDELQKLILERGIKQISPLKQCFLNVPSLSIPIIIQCIIDKAINCFKFLLISGIQDPKETIKDSNALWHYDSILNQRYQPKRYEWDCMAMAIYYGQIEIIKLLEDQGIQKGNKLEHIEAAILSYRNSIAKQIIIQMKANNSSVINEFLMRGLITATKNNNIRAAKFLIKNGAKIVIERSEIPFLYVVKKKTPLHIAIENSSFEMIEILISKGADINAKDIIYQIIL